MNNGQVPVGIIGTGAYLPEKVLTNADLEKMVDTSDEWIVSRTGIRERRIASSEEASSDLAYHASKQALQSAGISADELDLIIVATITPDMFFPSTACVLQERLGATKAAAFDLAAACSGFLYGLASATQFIATKMYRYVLVVGVDCLSKITDWKDRNTCVLFGDGAGAVVLGPVSEQGGFHAFELGADGSGGKWLNLRGGGSRHPITQEVLDQRMQYIYMNGREVFKFAVRVMGSASEQVIAKAGWEKEDVDFLVPHQANIRIIESAINRLKLSEDRVVINVDRYGNMSSASIPVALNEAVLDGRIQQGDKVVLVGFGGGLTWGAAALTWADRAGGDEM